MLRLSFERSARPCRGSLRGGWLRQHCRLTAAGAPSRALRGRSGTHSHQQSGARYPAQNWRIAPTRAGFTQRPLYPLLPRCAVPATAGAPSLELRALAGLATPPSSSGARAVRPLAAAGGSPGLAAAHPRSHPGANCRGGNTPARGMPSARGSKLPLPGLSERSAPPLTRLRFAFTLARWHRCDLQHRPQRLPACPPAGMRGGGHFVTRKAAFPASGRRGRSLLILWP